jgi:hypothetical protein
LAVRSPHATGLASSLSGYFSLTGQRCLFRHRRHGGRFSRILPRSRVLPGPHAPFVPPFGVFRLADLRFQRPPESFVPCWCAVITVGPLGHCDSPAGRNRPHATSLNWPRLLIAARRLGSISRFGQRANALRGTGESCLLLTRLTPSLQEGPNQPAWSNLSPVARDYPEQIGFNFHFDQPVVLSMNWEQTIRILFSVN